MVKQQQEAWQAEQTGMQQGRNLYPQLQVVGEGERKEQEESRMNKKI